MKPSSHHHHLANRRFFLLLLLLLLWMINQVSSDFVILKETLNKDIDNDSIAQTQISNQCDHQSADTNHCLIAHIINDDDYIGFSYRSNHQQQQTPFNSTDNRYIEFKLMVTPPPTTTTTATTPILSVSIDTDGIVVLNNNTLYVEESSSNRDGGETNFFTQYRLIRIYLGRLNIKDNSQFKSIRIQCSLKQSIIYLSSVSLLLNRGFNTNNNNDSNDRGRRGKIAAGVVVPLVVLIIIALIIIVYKRKKQSDKKFISNLYDNQSIGSRYGGGGGAGGQSFNGQSFNDQSNGGDPNAIEMTVFSSTPTPPMTITNQMSIIVEKPITTPTSLSPPPSPPPPPPIPSPIFPPKIKSNRAYYSTPNPLKSINFSPPLPPPPPPNPTPTSPPPHPAKIFGQPIKGDKVPYIVLSTIEHLTRYGLKEQGILRVAGSKVQVDKLVQLYDSGLSVNLIESTNDIHAVGDVLKKYLRELPQSLLTENVDHIIFMQDKQQQIECLKKLIDSMQEFERSTIEVLFKFLSLVSLHSDENKMNNSNISLIFSPTLNFVPDLIDLFIKHCEIIF
ncbi:hypothetical protein DFA_02243 [Cavenderia fasciculata]|uniref:Rho-GAP domain-containing protein n=1 Tax=Cavenderia fasciculata TaxID=261658 RepID=F4PYX1_CACFS|nr:uncharacterized protein DFA_02243 [Cavenderia fasciculata]EGG19000.1 hypothetical protein DFA_02243 [Cavenderia fasciculata]|eukprot:XP_004357484.1 hypothetical protein DFA_02243 [Cavenderia fasciculata]